MHSIHDPARRGPRARIVLWTMVLALIVTAPAAAQLAVSSKPVYPEIVEVGDTDLAVSLVIRNNSGTEVGDVEISDILHNPSCQNVSFPCSAPDGTVFDVSTTATGAAACSGITFDVVLDEPPQDRRRFIPDAPIILGMDEECVINFTVDVIALPGSDADAATDGSQTFQTSNARADDTDSALFGFGSGSDLTTVVGPGIEVTKECVDASAPGEPITFSGTVTNSGNVELTNVVVVDDSGTPGDTSDDQTVFGPATLAVGESQGFNGEYTTDVSPSTDVVTASGDWSVTTVGGSASGSVSDTAEATCEVLVEPAIEVTKECTDGFGADASISFSGTVTNSGNITLTDVTVVDDSGTPADTSDDQTVFGPATLEPGESQTFEGSYVPGEVPSTDVVTASGEWTFEGETDTVSATAEATCTVVACDVEIDKQISCDGGATFVDVTGGDDADGSAVEACVGWSAFDGNAAEPVIVRYEVVNTGDVDVSCTLSDTNALILTGALTFDVLAGETNVVVDDDQACSAELDDLEPDTAMLECLCVGFEDQGAIQAQDSASFECQEPGLAVNKTCEEQVDGVNAVEIEVTNPENPDGAVLDNCVVSDALAPGCDGTVVGPLLPGDTEILACDVEGLTEDTLNEVSVTCDIVGSGGKTLTRTAEDLCEVELGCLTRTPGYWGTHPDVAALFLPVDSCGLTLDNTFAFTDFSTTEDVCFGGRDFKEAETSPQQLQLIRQCTAAALNFSATQFFGGSCEAELPGIRAAFDFCCSDLCASAPTKDEITASGCIERLDFFNNLGGNELDDTELCPNAELGTTAPCSADPQSCRDARNNGFVNPRDLGEGKEAGSGKPEPSGNRGGRSGS